MYLICEKGPNYVHTNFKLQESVGNYFLYYKRDAAEELLNNPTVRVHQMCTLMKQSSEMLQIFLEID